MAGEKKDWTMPYVVLDLRILIVLGLVWVLSLIPGYFAGRDRSAGAEGLLLALIFGPIGVVAALGLDRRAKCYRCGGRIENRIKVCPHCGISYAGAEWPQEDSAAYASKEQKRKAEAELEALAEAAARQVQPSPPNDRTA
jgi:hypothetical protein